MTQPPVLLVVERSAWCAAMPPWARKKGARRLTSVVVDVRRQAPVRALQPPGADGVVRRDVDLGLDLAVWPGDLDLVDGCAADVGRGTAGHEGLVPRRVGAEFLYGDLVCAGLGGLGPGCQIVRRDLRGLAWAKSYLRSCCRPR